MNDENFNLLKKASDKLLLAAKKTYSDQGLALTQLLIAINEYDLTCCTIQAKVDLELSQFEAEFNKKEVV